MYVPPGLRGGNRLAATLYSRLRRFWFVYKRNGRVRTLVWCVSAFSYHVHYSRVFAGGTGLQAALYARLQRFWFTYKRNGGVWIWFWCVSTILYHVHFSWVARGEPVCRWLSTYGCGDFGPHISGAGRRGFCLNVFQQLNSPRINPPGCAGRTSLPAALYLRLRQFWFVYKRNRRVGICFCVFQQFYTTYISPGSARGESACRRLSIHGCGDFGSYTSGTVG